MSCEVQVEKMWIGVAEFGIHSLDVL